MAPGYARDRVPQAGLAPGTIVFTLDGALPVEVLVPGDRIVTRSGARVLKEVTVLSGARGFLLRFDQPEVIYADGQELLAA
jgi:hypothetical protein